MKCWKLLSLQQGVENIVHLIFACRQPIWQSDLWTVMKFFEKKVARFFLSIPQAANNSKQIEQLSDYACQNWSAIDLNSHPKSCNKFNHIISRLLSISPRPQIKSLSTSGPTDDYNFSIRLNKSHKLSLNQ